MTTPKCPYCNSDMVYVKEKIYNNFPDLSDSPRTKIYTCRSHITEYCYGAVE